MSFPAMYRNRGNVGVTWGETNTAVKLRIPPVACCTPEELATPRASAVDAAIAETCVPPAPVVMLGVSDNSTPHVLLQGRVAGVGMPPPGPGSGPPSALGAPLAVGFVWSKLDPAVTLTTAAGGTRDITYTTVQSAEFSHCVRDAKPGTYYVRAYARFALGGDITYSAAEDAVTFTLLPPTAGAICRPAPSTLPPVPE